MAISKLGGTTSDNWELISSVTPTNGAAAVNFTGLSLYKKLMIRWTGIVLAGSDSAIVRLNNDSNTANYTYQYRTTTYVLDDNDGGFIMTTSETNQLGYVFFADCDTNSIKTLTSGAGGPGSGTRTQFEGFYLASAPVTQVNLVTGSTFTAAGTVALYGVK